MTIRRGMLNTSEHVCLTEQTDRQTVLVCVCVRVCMCVWGGGGGVHVSFVDSNSTTDTDKRSRYIGNVRRLVVCSSAVHALLYLRTMHCRVTTPQLLRSPMLLPLLPKGVIGGGGLGVREWWRRKCNVVRSGRRGAYRYRGCLASRVTLEIPLSSFYVLVTAKRP